MSSMFVSLLVFACVFGGALAGLALRAVLPAQHLSADSKDAVRLGTGLIGTMAALVLGLLIGSVKSSYDAQKNEVTELAAHVAWLDRVLAQYGPETRAARALLRQATADAAARLGDGGPQAAQAAANAQSAALYDAIHQLAPANSAQRSLQTEALAICVNIGRTRALLFQQGNSSVAWPLLIGLVFWLTVIFIGFGLYAPPNTTVIVALGLCALSVAGAIFLILEMDRPFTGLIRIARPPLDNVLPPLSS